MTGGTGDVWLQCVVAHSVWLQDLNLRPLDPQVPRTGEIPDFPRLSKAQRALSPVMVCMNCVVLVPVRSLPALVLLAQDMSASEPLKT